MKGYTTDGRLSWLLSGAPNIRFVRFAKSHPISSIQSLQSLSIDVQENLSNLCHAIDVQEDLFGWKLGAVERRCLALHNGGEPPPKPTGI